MGENQLVQVPPVRGDGDSQRLERKRRRVAFHGAEYIEFQAELPTVVRFCGRKRVRRHGDGSCRVVVTKDDESVRLEMHARGLLDQSHTNASDVATEMDKEKELLQAYQQEMEAAIRAKGFEPLGNSLAEFHAQLQLIEWLQAQMDVLMDYDQQHQQEPTTASSPLDDLAAKSTKQLHLLKKAFGGFFKDEGYAFGRRLLTVEQFLQSLELDQLVEQAKARNVVLSEDETQEIANVKVCESELLASHPALNGRLLRLLNLHELRLEATCHPLAETATVTSSSKENGAAHAAADKDKDENSVNTPAKPEESSSGRKTKKKWLMILRPLVRDAVRLEKQEDKHKELLVQKLSPLVEEEMTQISRQLLLRVLCNTLQSIDPTHIVSNVSTQDIPALVRELFEWYQKGKVLPPPLKMGHCKEANGTNEMAKVSHGTQEKEQEQAGESAT